MASFQHPNLALIYGAETWRGTPLLVVEYLAGGTLADRLRERRRSLAETLEVGLIVLNVLERCHGAGVLHRDIKPSNIGYTAEDAPKLLDFGLAQLIDETQVAGREMSASGEGSLPFAGTPLYMSPEAIAGAPPDPSFDLWGLAAVLYEALTGRAAFRSSSRAETLARIRVGAAPDPRELCAEIRPAVARFLKDALARDRRRRPANVAEFRQRLNALHDHLTE
jgi:serine/threonine protein kinase